MRAHVLESDANNFQAYLPADLEAGNDMLDEVHGIPLADRWRPVRMVIERESRRRNPPGDCPCIFHGSITPALSQRAVDTLRDLLEPVGEFLPLECAAEPLWIYNCTHFAEVLDEAASDILLHSDGTVMHIRRHAWRPEVERETAFRLHHLCYSPVYVTDTVVQRIRDTGLRGFLFRD